MGTHVEELATLPPVIAAEPKPRTGPGLVFWGLMGLAIASLAAGVALRVFSILPFWADPGVARRAWEAMPIASKVSAAVSFILVIYTLAGVLHRKNDDRTELKSPQSKYPRPGIISAICVLGFTTVFLGFALVVSRLIQKAEIEANEWYFLFPEISVTALSMAGLADMRRWAVYAYAGLFVVELAMLHIMGYVWNYANISFRCMMIAIMLAYFKRMS